MRPLLSIILLALLALPVLAEETTDAPATPGPFLRVTPLDAVEGGVVFRLGWAHHYRPSGAHPPMAVGHLSKVYTPPAEPEPEPEPEPVVVKDKRDAFEKLESVPDVEDELLGDLMTDLEEERLVEASPSRGEAAQWAGQLEGETVASRIDDGDDGAEVLPRANFWAGAATWAGVPAFAPGNRLNKGELSAAVDICRVGIVPGATPITLRDRSHDFATMVFVRAFTGPTNAPESIRVKLELFTTPESTGSVAAVEMMTGPLGMQITGPRTEQPVFETPEAVRERWLKESAEQLRNRSGTEYFASPDGKEDATGTRDDPFDLQTALNRKEETKPGDVLWLLGGVYEAPEHQYKVPIREKKKPAKKASPKMDPGPDANLELDADLADAFEELVDEEAWRKKKEEAKKPKFTIRSKYFFESTLSGTPEQPVIVRAVPGERVVIRGGWNIGGAHAWYWGFEIGEPTERANNRELGNRFRFSTMGGKLIHVRIHGTDVGLSVGGSTYDQDIYGCVIHGFGAWPDEGDPGHEYHYNGWGLGVLSRGGILRVIDNVIYGGYGSGIYAFHDTCMHSMILEGNFVFSAGMQMEGYAAMNVVIPWHEAVDQVMFTDNVLYHPYGKKPNFWSAAHMFSSGPSAGLTVKRNIFWGGYPAFASPGWCSVYAAANVFAADESFAWLSDSTLYPDGNEFDGNTFVRLPPQGKGTFETGFHKPVGPFTVGSRGLTLEEWRAEGRDRESRVIDAADWTPRVVVRPSLFEKGRVHVAVVGWGDAQDVAVDLLEHLAKGHEVSVFNVQDPDTPLHSGVYEGGTLTLTKGSFAITPDFDAYVVTSAP